MMLKGQLLFRYTCKVGVTLILQILKLKNKYISCAGI